MWLELNWKKQNKSEVIFRAALSKAVDCAANQSPEVRVLKCARLSGPVEMRPLTLEQQIQSNKKRFCKLLLGLLFLNDQTSLPSLFLAERKLDCNFLFDFSILCENIFFCQIAELRAWTEVEGLPLDRSLATSNLRCALSYEYVKNIVLLICFRLSN